MQDSPTRTNAQWLAALRTGGAEGARAQSELRELVLRGLAHGLARKNVARSMLEDFAHESVLRILQHLDSFRDESRFSTWALAIAMRVAFNELRRQRWRDVPLDGLAPREEANMPVRSGAAPPSPERALARREIVAALERAVRERLTDRQRTIVIAELREMPQEEIAARLGTNRNALYKLGHDARRAMQTALEEAGFDRDSVRAAFEEP